MGRGPEAFSISMAMARASKSPTQIGSRASPFASLRITMGMFVEGSTIRPRIFISICTASFPWELLPCVSKIHLYDGFANQAVGQASGHAHFPVAAGGRKNRLCGGEVECLIL